MTRLGIAIIALFLFAACHTNRAPAPDNKTVFKYNEPAGITSLDPAFSNNLENIWAVNQVFNGLVQMDSKLDVTPCIAHSWEVSEDGLEYTFYLRDDVFFHDHAQFENGKGRKVIASDFVYSFHRIIDPNVVSYGKNLFEQHLDKSEKSNYLGFKAENDTVLKIYLEEPHPAFLGILTMQFFSVVPKEVVEYYQQDFRRNPVGTGPFLFKTWKEGVKLVLVKNHHYFEKDGDQQLPYLDAVSISFIKDRQIAFLDFLKGQYDFLSGVTSIYRDELLTSQGQLSEKYHGKLIIQKQPYLKTDYLGILVDEDLERVINSPLKKKALRKAINHAIDRKKMVSYLRNNIGIPATAGFVPPGFPMFDKKRTEGYDYNVEKAKELMVNAGFPNGDGLPTITLNTTAPYQDLCEFIQHEISKIQIRSKIEIIEPAAFREMVAQSKLNLFRKSWVGDYPDAENFLALFYSKNFCPSGPNYTHFDNYSYDRLYEKAMAEVNDSIRYEYYRQMDQMIIDEAPIIPLYYDEVMRIVQNNITGLETNPMNLLVLKRVKKSNTKVL